MSIERKPALRTILICVGVLALVASFPFIVIWASLEVRGQYSPAIWLRDYLVQPAIEVIPKESRYRVMYTRYVIWQCQSHPAVCRVAADSDAGQPNNSLQADGPDGPRA